MRRFLMVSTSRRAAQRWMDRFIAMNRQNVDTTCRASLTVKMRVGDEYVFCQLDDRLRAFEAHAVHFDHRSCAVMSTAQEDLLRMLPTRVRL